MQMNQFSAMHTVTKPKPLFPILGGEIHVLIKELHFLKTSVDLSSSFPVVQKALIADPLYYILCIIIHIVLYVMFHT